MIDLSKIKAPGWQRIVEELARAAPDDRAFLARLLSVQGQVAGARQAVLLSVSPGPATEGGQPEPRVGLVWPPRDGPPNVEHEREVMDAARACASSRQTRVFGLDATDGMYEAGEKGYIVATPVGSPLTPDGPSPQVITLLIEQRSRQALQTTLALAEVLSGYTHGHAARRELLRLKASTAALELATRLVAGINQAQGFKGACLQVCNDLTRQLGLDRVALGWVKGIGQSSGVVRLRAMSDTEQIDRRMAMAKKIESAMDECLDQEQAVMHPPPPPEGEGGDVVLSQSIAHAHRELAASDARLRVASVPLRAHDRVVGVLTFESAAEPAVLGVNMVELIQATMDLVSPVLAVRRSDDRSLATRAAASAVRTGAWLVGPKHTVWKLALLAATAVVMTLIFVKAPYRIEAPVELMARTQRVISAPFDGIVERLGEGIEKGARVKAGDVLVKLRTTELELGAQEALMTIQRAQTEADAFQNQGKQADAEQALAEVRSARAQLELYRYKISQATITSPIDGVIIEGELKDRLGSSIKLGDAIFVVADINDLVAVAKVSDRDISYITDAMTGAIATKADPDERLPIEVEAIVPSARPEEGSNSFEVRARLTEPAPWMRPGMEGLVKLNTGSKPLGWILGRRISDTLRMWLWW